MFKKCKSRHGFALIELIIVIAIIASLIAVGVVSTIEIKKNLKQKELDSIAEVIYTAAQSRLTELRGANLEDDYMSIDEEFEIDKTQLPLDATDKVLDEFKAGHMAYLSNDNLGNGIMRQLAAAIVPYDHLDKVVWDGHWIIEYNYKSGIIYGVFFSENPIDYQTIIDNDNNNAEKDNFRMSKAARKKVGLGYYGGSAAMAQINTDTILMPTVTVDNGDALIATFTCKTPEGYVIDKNTFRFSYTISDEFNNNSDTRSDTILAKDITVNGTGTSSEFTYTLVLDDPFNGVYWKDVTGDFNPGDKMKIVLTASAKLIESDKAGGASNEDYKKALSYSANDKFNSLFSDDTSNTKAGIDNLRHLQNLDKETSGVVENIKKADLKYDLKVPEEINFKPITNENLEEFEGNSCKIEDLKTNADEAGLFGKLYGNVSNLTLVNPTAISDTTTATKDKEGNDIIYAAGAIAAYTAGNNRVTLTNCNVIDATVSCKLGPSGGLIGRALTDLYIFTSSVRMENNLPAADAEGQLSQYAIDSRQNAGGLLGQMDAWKCFYSENSYAATVVRSDGSTGGIVGISNNAQQVKLWRCYADCYLYGKQTGGLLGAGTVNALARANCCYAAGYLYGTEESAGLSLTTGHKGTDTEKAQKMELVSCYTVDEFMGDGNNYATVKQGVNKGSVFYLNAGNMAAKTGEKISKAGDLKLPADFAPTVQKANAYNLLKQFDPKPEKYEYPGIGQYTTCPELHHYNDWGPLDDGNQATVKVDVTNAEKLSIKITVESDSKKQTETVPLVYTIYEIGTNWTRDESRKVTIKYDLPITSGKGTYEVTLDDLSSSNKQFANLTLANVSHTPQSGEDTTQPIFKNFHIGCICEIEATVTGYEINKDTSSQNVKRFSSLFANTSGGCTGHIAWGRHLQNLNPDTSKVDSRYAYVEFDQNINFGSGSAWQKAYGAKTFVPITNTKIMTVEGHNYSIADLTVNTSGNYGGLFAQFGVNNDLSSKRSIKNLTLVRPNITANYSVGGFVGVSRGGFNTSGITDGGIIALTMENCHVIDGQVYSKTNNAGGLIGNNWSTTKIANCSVRLDKVKPTVSAAGNCSTPNVNAVTTSNGAGGLIGWAEGSGITIENSFAAVVVGSKNCENVGGLIGRDDAKNLTIRNSYADCYCIGNDVGGLIGWIEGNDRVENVTIDHCYAAGYAFQKSDSSNQSGIADCRNSTNVKVTLQSVYTVVKPSKAANYAATIDVTPVSSSDVYYGTAGGRVNNGTKMAASQKNAAAFASALGGNFIAPTAANVHPYNLMSQGLTGADFTTPVLKSIAHYGDWEQVNTKTSTVKTGFVYYEVYSDNSVGLYYPDGSTSAGYELKTLAANDTVKVIGDGYGVAFNAEDADGVATIGGSKSTTISKAAKAGPVIDLDNGSVICGLPTSWMNPKTDCSDYDSYDKNIFSSVTVAYSGISHASENYTYIPFYAKTIFGTAVKTTDPLNKAGTIAIRSPRQLFSLSWLYTAYQGKYGTDNSSDGDKVKASAFSQECDLEYYYYEWSTYMGADYGRQIPIGKQHNNFVSDYAGNGHIIRDVKLTIRGNGVSKYYHGGLFGYVDTYPNAESWPSTPNMNTSFPGVNHLTKITDLYLVNEHLTGDDAKIMNPSAKQDKDKYPSKVGTFVSVLQNATIENCGVSGYDIYYTGNPDGTSGNALEISIGGFAGQVEYYGTVDNCYVTDLDLGLNKATVMDSRAGYVYWNEVGGFVGRMGCSTKKYVNATIKNCYVDGRMTVDGEDNTSAYKYYGTFAGMTHMGENGGNAGNKCENCVCAIQVIGGKPSAFTLSYDSDKNKYFVKDTCYYITKIGSTTYNCGKENTITSKHATAKTFDSQQALRNFLAVNKIATTLP